MQQLELNFDAVIEEVIKDPKTSNPTVQEDRLWQDDGWIARVVKSEDGEGWAVVMIKEGESEPALVSPWIVMGRDKKKPKPLDAAAFAALVRTASDTLRHHEQQLHASLHKNVDISIDHARYTVTLDIVPDEDSPYAVLTALNAMGEELARKRVPPNYKLTRTSARSWLMSNTESSVY